MEGRWGWGRGWMGWKQRTFLLQQRPPPSSSSESSVSALFAYKAASINDLNIVLYFFLIPKRENVSVSQARLFLTSLMLTLFSQLHDYYLRCLNSCQPLVAYSV